MTGLDQYLLPYIFVQVAAVIFLLIALRNTRLARLLFALLFLYAAAINMQLGLRNPDAYLDYAWLALPFYRDFINGWFSQYKMVGSGFPFSLIVSVAALLILKRDPKQYLWRKPSIMHGAMGKGLFVN